MKVDFFEGTMFLEPKSEEEQKNLQAWRDSIPATVREKAEVAVRPYDPETGLKVGDIVQLKSGGPTMTVENIGREITCLWFPSWLGNEANHGDFPETVLKPATPED